MADRNERHFLEFYTPARRLRQRRITQTEGRQRSNWFHHDKENPDGETTPNDTDGEDGQSGQRRRLFTRSASKKIVRVGLRKKDFGSNDNRENSSRDLASAHLAATSAATDTDLGFLSPKEPRLSRALFSKDAATTTNTSTTTSPTKSPLHTAFSHVGTTRSNLLSEYRSKQSLLSSSKTRVSSFSSPSLRLRSPSLWRTVRNNRNTEIDSSFNTAAANATITTAETTDSSTTPSSSLLPSQTSGKIAKEGIFQIAETPSPVGKPRLATEPFTEPTKRYSSWSPPGTSKLLRKYRQRIHQEQLESPLASDAVTPKTNGRKGLRLMDSGAQRCRTRRPVLRSGGTTQTKPNDKLSLLSPSTASRLKKDIVSYRYAHGRAIDNASAIPSATLEEEIIFHQEETTGTTTTTTNSLEKDYKEVSGCEDPSPEREGEEIIPSPSSNFAKDAPESIKDNDGERTTNVESSVDHEVDGVFRNTRSATRAAARRCSAIHHAGTPSDGTITTDTVVEEPEPIAGSMSNGDTDEAGVFRSTRSATRARRKSLAKAAQAITAAEVVITTKTQHEIAPTPNTNLPLSSTPQKFQIGREENSFVDAQDTPSSKGSIQSLWDVINCGEDSYPHSNSSTEAKMINTNIVSRCSDCVNPMASTLMKMWREEQGEVQGQQEDKETNRWSSPPRKSFSSDLALVYGLERVENLTLARPKALPAQSPQNYSVLEP